ncbi:MAG TPA: glycosyl hydrolase [Pseudobacteroides sp.]|uniref:glycosyl hydrolase n=1 Tax=Pseudobacteroides sp. TaxID=1968840 RepID=UPI002F92507B
MLRKRVLSAFVALATTAASFAMPIGAGAAYAADENEAINISGYITPDFISNNKPIKEGFKVSVLGTELTGVTDAAGFFRIDGVQKQDASYNLIISKPGYLSRLVKNVPGNNKSLVSTSEKPLNLWAGDIPKNGAADNMINMADVFAIAKAFNSVAGDVNFNADVNFDLDATISMQDVVILAKHFGATPADYEDAAIITPTPTSTPVPTNTPTPTPTGKPSPKTDINVYKDGLLIGWQDWSWTCDRDFANSEVAKEGNSIAVTYTGAWAALSLYSPTKIDTAGYESINFWVNGGDSDKNLGLYCITDAVADTASATVEFTAKAGEWTEVKIKLSELGNPETIQRINIQERSGAAQTTIYIDNLTLAAIPVQVSAKTFTVYDDALAAGLQDWSWNASKDTEVTTTVKNGTKSLGVTYTGGWAALSLYSPEKIATEGYDMIKFWVNGGDSDKKVGFFITKDAADDTSLTPKVEFTAKAGEWTEIKIKLSELANPETIQRINFQEMGGSAQTQIYFDDIVISGTPVVQDKILKLYEDSLPAGFQNWSWSSQVDFANTTNVKEGSGSISVEYTGAWAALSLYSAQVINTAGYESIKFWVNGGDSDKKLGFSIMRDAADETSTSPNINFTAKAGEWTEITMKLSELGSPAAIQRINIQELAGSAQTPIYIDEIRLVGSGTNEPKPTPIPDPNPGPRTDKAKISTSGYDVSPIDAVDVNATKETASLFAALKGIGGKNLMFGQQHATTFGLTTGGSKDGTQSDVKNNVGAFPAVFGWDTLSIEGKESPGNISLPVEKNIKLLADVVKKAHATGGVITLSAHMPNFVTGGDFYDLNGNVVTHILPGGSKHAEYNKFLDNIATFANSIEDENGNLIPVIFRPFHENTGSWFWWGAAFCTPDQYIKLFRYTVDYLRDVKGVHNFLYAYSPSSTFSTEEEYLERYPGDNYVDVLGFDQYDDSGSMTSEERWMKSIVSRTELLTEMADKRGKVVTITETGIASGIKKENNVNKSWFTTLLNALKESAAAGKNKAAYMLVWANFDMNQFWVPYMHHSIYGNSELLQDFVNFYNDDFTVFSDTINGFYDLDVDTVAEKPYMYISNLYDGTTVTGPTNVKAKVFANGKTVSSVTLKTPSNAALAMTKDTDGQYSALWTPLKEENGTKLSLTVTVKYSDETIQEETISVKVLGEVVLKKFTFDTELGDVTYDGSYAPEDASVTGTVSYDSGLKAIKVDSKFVDNGDSSDWTYEELKVKLSGINNAVNMSDVNKVAFDIILPETAKDTLFKPYTMALMPAEPGYKKYGEGALELRLSDFKQDTESTGDYGKMYRYNVVVDLEDRTATALIMAFVAFDWNYEGPIFIDNIAFINGIKQKPSDPALVDDFEGYFSDNEELKNAYTQAGDSSTVSLVPHNSGKAVKFDYTIGTNGYSGIVKQTGGVDWSSMNALSMWITPDGLNQKMVVQIRANGIYFEAYPVFADSAEKNLVFSFSGFTPAPWESEANKAAALKDNLNSIEAVGIYVNQVDDFTGNGTLIMDDIKAINVD